jgi:hypothetical protein
VFFAPFFASINHARMPLLLQVSSNNGIFKMEPVFHHDHLSKLHFSSSQNGMQMPLRSVMSKLNKKAKQAETPIETFFSASFVMFRAEE